MRALGAAVVPSIAGTRLLEGEAGQLKDVVEALPNWRYTPELKTTKVPEGSRLGRAKACSRQGLERSDVGTIRQAGP